MLINPLKGILENIDINIDKGIWQNVVIDKAIMRHRQRRNVTSHHFTSFLFTCFHFYVYSNFFGYYQLKDKYNTYEHIILIPSVPL